MLDELVEAGYTGTELGDWGYMPTDPVCAASGTRQARTGDAGRVRAGGAEARIRACRHGHRQRGEDSALAGCRGAAPAPYLVLADDNGSVPGTNPHGGRVTPARGLECGGVERYSAPAQTQLAHAVFEETGLKTVFHHHCAGYVETPDEIATLLELTNPADARAWSSTPGHYCYGAGGGLRRGGRARTLRRSRLVHTLQRLPSRKSHGGRGRNSGITSRPYATESSAN